MEQVKLAIIGAGPAGFTAGIYSSRAQLAPVEYVGTLWGGQLMNTTLVENWPGTEAGVMGPELMDQMRKQAIKFGTTMKSERIWAVDFSERPFRLWSKLPDGLSEEEMVKLKGEEYAQKLPVIRASEHQVEAQAVILATGAAAIMLGLEREDKLLGRGVATCAVCDAAFYREKIAAVVGGGDAAVEDALALTKFAKKVYLIVRGEKLRASKIMAERVEKHERVEILWQTQVVKLMGEEKLSGVMVSDPKGEREVALDGLFYAIGHKPVTEFVQDQVMLDSHGYVVTRLGLSAMGVSEAREHVGENGLVEFPTMTSVEGVFAAGDNVDFRYRQAITAAAMGCQAALDAERWLESQ